MSFWFDPPQQQVVNPEDMAVEWGGKSEFTAGWE
jgi:hypothetical protein